MRKLTLITEVLRVTGDGTIRCPPMLSRAGGWRLATSIGPVPSGHPVDGGGAVPPVTTAVWADVTLFSPLAFFAVT